MDVPTAKQVAHVRGEAYTPLDKEALSRIRRFYRRRSFADLRVEEMAEDDLLRHTGSATLTLWERSPAASRWV